MAPDTPRRHRVKPGDQVLVFAEVTHVEGENAHWRINSLGLGVFAGHFESLGDDSDPMTEEEQVIYYNITNTLPVERIVMYDQDVMFLGDEVYWDQAEVMQAQIDGIDIPIKWTHTEPMDHREYLDYRAQNSADFKSILASSATLYNPKVPQGRA